MEIELTRHCVDRFHERFRPALDLIRARRELELLMAFAEVADEPPEWVAAKMRQRADAYLIIGEDLVVPVARLGPCGETLIAKTCLDRGGISEPARRRRNERGRARRAGRRSRRR